MGKYLVVTLGCRSNQYESQAYICQLKKLGYPQAKKDENNNWAFGHTENMLLVFINNKNLSRND